MVYPLSSYFYLFLLFMGAALASLLCVCMGKLTKKKYYKFRFSLSMVLFSLALFFLVMLLLHLGESNNVFWYFRTHIGFSVFYFLLGLLCGTFIRIVLPVTAFLYLSLSVLMGIRLYKNYCFRPEAVTISVSETSIRSVNSFLPVFEYDFTPRDSSDNVLCYLVFEECHLSEDLLIPLPHIWYKPLGVNIDFFPPVTENRHDSIVQKFSDAVYNRLVSKSKINVLLVMRTEVYPVFYILKFKTIDDDFLPELVRIM